jgi:hypothetical protein
MSFLDGSCFEASDDGADAAPAAKAPAAKAPKASKPKAAKTKKEVA